MSPLSRRAVTTVLTTRAIGAGLTFAMVLVVASRLDVGDVGVVLFGWSSVQFMSSLLRCGCDPLLLRVASEGHLRADHRRTRSAFLTMSALTTTVTLATAAVLIAGRAALARSLLDDAPTEVVVRFALCLPPLVVSLMAVEVLKGTGHVDAGSFVQTGAPSAVAMVVALATSADSAGAFATAFLIASIAVGCASAAAAIGSLGGLSPRQPTPTSTIVRSAAPALGFESCRIAMAWAPMLALAFVATADELGVFGLANRIAMLANVAIVATGNLLAPHLARLAVAGDHAGVEREVRRVAAAMLAGGALLLVCTVLAARPLLAWISPGIDAAATIALLVTAQVVRAVTNPALLALAMLADELRMFRDSLVAAAVTVALAWPLASAWGAEGAAVAAIVAATSLGVLNVRSLRRGHGIAPLPGSARLVDT